MTSPPTLLIVALVPLILWRLHSRYRKLVSRQKSHAWRHWFAAVFFALLLLVFAAAAIMDPWAEAALAAGILVGVVLSRFGLGATRFESTPGGIFFTPSGRIGLVLTLLLVARVLYRLFEISTLSSGARPGQMQDFARSPLTLVVFGMLASYFAAYAIGILRWRRARASEPATPGGTP